jgi:hypothetical protein
MTSPASGDEETASLNLSSGQEKKKAPEANKFRRVSVVLFVAVSCFIAASFFALTEDSSRRLGRWPCPDCSPPCFSSKTQVNVLHKGHLPVSQVKIGDFVQSRQDGSFSRVWGFEHKPNGKTEFYQLSSSSGPLLELTERHMVYLNSKKLPVPANQVRVGDVLKTTNHANKDAVVEEIKVIHDEGYHNVFTDDGTVVTNDGVVASSWVTGPTTGNQSEFYDIGPFRKAIHWHTLAQVVHAPLRFTCKAVWFGFCSNEHFHDAEDGKPKYILFLLKLESLPVSLQFILFPLVFGLGLIFTLLEYGYDNSHNVLNAMISNLGVGAVSATAAAIIPSLGFFYFQNKQHSSSLNARKQN